MKKEVGGVLRKSVFFVFILSLVFFAGYVLAIIVITPTSQSVNESISNIFNVTVNHTFSGGINNNITRVNITLPSGFTYVTASNGTSVTTNSFSNTSTTALSWNNSAGLVLNVTRQHFSFNATANTTTIGVFNISIYAINATGVIVNHTNLSVTVNDTTKPLVEAANITSPLSFANYSGTLVLNTTIEDNGPLSRVFFNITNSSGSQNGTYTASNPTGDIWNSTVDTTVYADGIYNVTVFANDTGNNLNSTARVFTVRFDNTLPAVSLSKNSNSNTTALVVSITISDANGVSSACSAVGESGATISGSGDSQTLTINGLSCGNSYEAGALCSDSAGNLKSATSVFAMNDCTTTSSGGSGGGGGSSSSSGSSWSSTFARDSQPFESAGSVTSNLGGSQRVKLKLGGETHYVGVKSLTSTSAVIEVSSTPQQATFNVGESKKFDVNGDNYYDMKVTLISISAGKANVIMESISEQVMVAQPETQANNAEESSEEQVSLSPGEEEGLGMKHLVWIIALLVIVGVVVFFIKRR